MHSPRESANNGLSTLHLRVITTRWGDEASVRDQVAQLDVIGVSELVASVFGTPDDRERTYALLATLV